MLEFRELAKYSVNAGSYRLKVQLTFHQGWQEQGFPQLVAHIYNKPNTIVNAAQAVFSRQGFCSAADAYPDLHVEAGIEREFLLQGRNENLAYVCLEYESLGVSAFFLLHTHLVYSV